MFQELKINKKVTQQKVDFELSGFYCTLKIKQSRKIDGQSELLIVEPTLLLLSFACGHCGIIQFVSSRLFVWVVI